jgi:ketosteroid isomerase-like protein
MSVLALSTRRSRRSRLPVLGSPIILAALALVLTPQAHDLHAQAPLGALTPAPPDIVLSGVSIPPHLSGLEPALRAHLRAWDGEDPEAVLSVLAPGAVAFTRSGTMDGPALRASILDLVPHLRIRGASVYLVEESGGWVSVGTYLQLESLLDDAGEARVGTLHTVWEEGADGRWRIVFLAALWMEADHGGETIRPRANRLSNGSSMP